jgi:hypothetical protein
VVSSESGSAGSVSGSTPAVSDGAGAADVGLEVALVASVRGACAVAEGASCAEPCSAGASVAALG